MVSQQALSALLQDVNVQQVARLAGVSPKTLYRLRSGANHSPSLNTAERILTAVRAWRRLVAASSAPQSRGASTKKTTPVAPGV